MKNDKTWKVLFAVFLVLCAIAIGAYIYNNRYTEIRISGLENAVVFDRWTHDAVFYTAEGVKRYKMKDAGYVGSTKKPFFTSGNPSKNARRLHRTLSEDYGCDLGSLGDMYDAIINSPKNRRWLYNKCVEVGLNVGTYQEFKKALDLP